MHPKFTSISCRIGDTQTTVMHRQIYTHMEQFNKCTDPASGIKTIKNTFKLSLCLSENDVLLNQYINGTQYILIGLGILMFIFNSCYSLVFSLKRTQNQSNLNSAISFQQQRHNIMCMCCACLTWLLNKLSFIQFIQHTNK